MSNKPSVFLDLSGRRWRAIRRVTLAGGVLTTLIALGFAAVLIIPQALPTLQEAKRAVGTPKPKPGLSTRAAAKRAADRLRLTAALARKPAPPALRPSQLKVEKNRVREPAAPVKRPVLNGTRPKIVAGFVVKWDDNSFASFAAHATDLDWVVGEWVFLTEGGTGLNIGPDFKVLDVVQQLPPKDRPRVFAMVSNVDTRTGKFDARLLRRLLGTPASQQAAAFQLVQAAQRYGFAGITIDFEDVPPDLLDKMFDFMRYLRAGLAPGGRLLTSALAAGSDSVLARRYAAVNDYLFVMLYDEHFGPGDPGPVASQSWYEMNARQVTKWITPEKSILALGTYGYHWDDGAGKLAGRELTFQDAMYLAKTNNALVQFDSVSLNPYLTWSDPDSTDHVVWFLDGTTAWNQARVGLQFGVAGAAMWRLGSEDPSLWKVISNDVDHPTPDMLQRIPSGYDAQFDGKGEMLRIQTRPIEGQRFLLSDSLTGLVKHERIAQYPSPWVVQRFGARDSMKVALTFDDGPDPRFTSAILDTLRSRGVKATFFIVGRQAEFGQHQPTHRLVVVIAAVVR